MITIDNQQYNPEDLSDEAKSHLSHLAFIEAETRRCQMNINILNVARQRIGEMLKKALPVGAAVLPVPAPVAAPVVLEKAKAGKRK